MVTMPTMASRGTIGLQEYRRQVVKIWRKWLETSNARMLIWANFNAFLARHPLPAARYYPRLHQLERISCVRNRMQEIRASGSVGGEGGNALAYPARVSCRPCRWEHAASAAAAAADSGTEGRVVGIAQNQAPRN